MTKDHRSVIASLGEGQRRALTARTNLPGLVHLAGHLGLIALCGALILAQVPGWPFLMLPHGILLVFLFTPLHECIHRTAFRGDGLNILLADLFGIIVGLQARWFLRFHVTHHRFTNDPERDPELAVDKSGTLASYAVYMSGLRYWQAQVRNLFVNAMGRNRDPFIAGAARSEIRAEAWRYLAVYGIAIAASFWLGTLSLVWVWLLPLLLGQPFLRAYLLAEHTGCPAGGNMLENSRTTMTNPLVRFLAWNMPYHIEHHAHPAVPFHKLPAFHALIRDHLGVTEQGYVRFHFRWLKRLAGGSGAFPPPRPRPGV